MTAVKARLLATDAHGSPDWLPTLTLAYSVGAAFNRSRLAGSSRLSRVCVRGF